MFDIGFAEILLVGVVGLLVIGPERLPGAIRTTSAWVSRFRRGFDEVRAEVQRELHNDAVMRELKESSDSIKRDLGHATQQIKNDVAQAGQGLSEPLTSAKAMLNGDAFNKSDPALEDSAQAQTLENVGDDALDAEKTIFDAARLDAEPLDAESLDTASQACDTVKAS
jgi:sec-independent protein translocase protein TatB